jgi:murein DD-endopeptidase MepM/ murein hydrolase activator NlpD
MFAELAAAASTHQSKSASPAPTASQRALSVSGSDLTPAAPTTVAPAAPNQPAAPTVSPGQNEQAARALDRVKMLVKQGLALSDQIHQDELAEADASLQLANSQAHLLQANTDLANSLQKLYDARMRLKADQGSLKLRLRDVYEQGDVGILQVLLNSRSLLDFMNRREYVNRVIHRDFSIVQQLHLDEQQMAQQSQRLQNAQAAKALQVAAIQTQAQRIGQAIADRSAILTATERDIETARQSVAEQDAANSQIASMLKQLQKSAALCLPGPGGARVYHLHWAGRFVMPVSGPITSPFGYRYHPILHVYKLHTGIDIGAAWGTPVHAAADGVVVQAGWLGAYGNGIVIAHGDGLATLYGHLSQIEVIEGQEVTPETEIGRVGSTGLSTGPHLHFEVRRYGTPIPPF